MVAISALLSGATAGIAVPKEGAIFFILGAILPDVDIYWCKLNDVFFSHQTLILSHRGWTHHIILPLLGIATSLLYSNVQFAYFFTGILLHDLMDMFSYLGIPYGFKYKQRVGLKVYKVGRLSEFLFLVVVIGLLLVFPFLIHKGCFM